MTSGRDYYSDNSLITSGGGIGPVNPQQPPKRRHGAYSVRSSLEDEPISVNLMDLLPGEGVFCFRFTVDGKETTHDAEQLYPYHAQS